MNVTLTLLVTKVAAALSRGLGRGGGGALPGLVAERLDPHLAAKLAAGLSGGVILVTGTNGKTTTTKLIAEFLEAMGLVVVTNSSGSNLKRGVTSALIRAADMGGRVRATVGLFEVDEASLRRVAPEVRPTHIVVTNLFRDQLDRYGELDTTAALIGEGIAGTDAQVYLNADDPLVASLATYARSPEQVHYFGIEGMPVSAVGEHQTATDSDRCPVCHSRLEFSRVFYGHVGHYRCPKGDFGRPAPTVAVTNVEEADRDGSRFVVAVRGKRTELRFPLPGTYNLYNALAAVSLGVGYGVEMPVMQAALAATRAAFGRVERVEIDGRTLCLLLIKNPAGFAQVLQTFVIGREAVRVLFVINDLAADGRDVSWLWDVPIEALGGHDTRAFTAGVRGADMAVRLHYAGVESQTAASVGEGIEALVAATPAGETAYILPTYTAMLEVRKLLARRTQMKAMPR
ncbi:MAG TPA: MurT ligase domain-containing protein [Candidatus Saccharimonadia bacterium]|nr:MurT ligase domain-containing protein [Candidatus Saccharimonadia bacterium]